MTSPYMKSFSGLHRTSQFAEPKLCCKNMVLRVGFFVAFKASQENSSWSHNFFITIVILYPYILIRAKGGLSILL